MTDAVILLLLLSAAVPLAVLVVLAAKNDSGPPTVYHVITPAPPRGDTAPRAPLQLLPKDDAE